MISHGTLSYHLPVSISYPVLNIDLKHIHEHIQTQTQTNTQTHRHSHTYSHSNSFGRGGTGNFMQVILISLTHNTQPHTHTPPHHGGCLMFHSGCLCFFNLPWTIDERQLVDEEANKRAHVHTHPATMTDLLEASDRLQVQHSIWVFFSDYK